ncbi:ABC transporter permease [Cohnella caldifontis]|uniref:ABC transporter permease n=1 Tax=Cohnella caldifontis TaxID=3027471 RepID=UPI0023EDB260|nr:ABC transporter permease [Cohnella sp. YIM B05605]
MSAYLAIGKIRFLAGMQYRAAAAAGVLTQLFFGLIFLMVYVAFYDQGGAGQPISLREVAAYIWLQQIFLSFIMLWLRDPEIFSLITSGNIAYELCRPCRLYAFWFAKLLATRISGAVLRCFPILLAVFFLPAPYALPLPASPAAFALFAAALLIGLCLVVSISMLIYISVFWTMSPVGSSLMVSVAGEFLAGMIVPVPLMPGWMQTVAYLLPFRWTTDFPFRVYAGNIPIGEAAWGIGVQLAWFAALVLFGQWLLNRALRRVVVQGG